MGDGLVGEPKGLLLLLLLLWRASGFEGTIVAESADDGMMELKNGTDLLKIGAWCLVVQTKAIKIK
jgi:hypothetical protein